MVTDLKQLLANLRPSLSPEEFVYHSIPDGRYGDCDELDPICAFREKEGLTLILEKQRAQLAGIAVTRPFRKITLEVHSALEAVGLTHAVSEALAQEDIACNVVAAFFHDHLFVPSQDANRALQALQKLSR